MANETDDDLREFLTSDQVIQRLLAQPTLRRRASTCVLPAVRVGAEWRFRRADLDTWIASQLVNSMDVRPAS